MALVDLLATCAEVKARLCLRRRVTLLRRMVTLLLLLLWLQGENRFIESICQTIFSIKGLLEILNNDSIANNLKRPYLRFFIWVYLNTASGMIESGAGDLPHDRCARTGFYKFQ